MANNLTYIVEKRVKELLDWKTLYLAVKQSMQAVSDKKIHQPVRSITNVLNTNNLLYSMPGYLQDSNYGSLACKMVTSFPDNGKNGKNLPTIQANILLFNSENGQLDAIVAATELTKWRTAAASVVATKAVFKRKDENGLILAIFGSGSQGEIHAEAFKHFFSLKEIKIWNVNFENARKLAEKLGKKFDGTINVQAAEKGEDCAKDADIIITATFATTPIVKAEWLNKENVHINAVGVTGKMATELDLPLYKKASVFCDSLENFKDELSELHALNIPIKGEIGNVLNKSLNITTNCNGITIFQSLGMPVEDCASAKLIYDLHKQTNNQ